MSKPVTVDANAPMKEVAGTMLRKGVACVVVVGEDGRARGTITERDFVEQGELPYSERGTPTILRVSLTSRDAASAYSDTRQSPAHRFMRALDAPLGETDPVEKALDHMLHRGKRNLVVLRDGRAVGTVGYHEFVRLTAKGPSRPMQRMELV